MNQVNPHLKLEVHPQRDELYTELHNRPFPVVAAPVRISHMALKRYTHAVADEIRHLQKIAHRYSVAPPELGCTCYYQNFGEFEVRWEQHTEFSTYTFIMTGVEGDAFNDTVLALLPHAWLEQIPGSFVVGTHLLVENENELTRDELRQYFEGQRLIGGDTQDNLARVWTAFRLHSDNFSRMLVLNRGLNPCQTGRLIQRVLEIEDYRIMALMAWPVAKKLGAVVTRMDRELVAAIEQISSITSLEDEQHLLTSLTSLAAEVEKYRGETNYRFAATQAYYALVKDRLQYFREAEIDGVQSIPFFLEKRLVPAIRTCESIQRRLEDLSCRISRADDLLSTRVDLTLESQNQRLLASMNKRSRMQLRMQETVETLSVAAVSYYLIAIIQLGLNTLEESGLITHANWIFMGAIPLVIVCIIWGANRIKKRIVQAGDDEI